MPFFLISTEISMFMLDRADHLDVSNLIDLIISYIWLTGW